jgi:cytochrome oxidase Cu insertion factor (SCO1/SenC/PrrC family)
MDSQSLLMVYLGSGAAHCAAVVEQHGNLIVALFLTGFLGSISHCVGMCGPFVMAQVSCRLENVSATNMREWHRVSGGLLLPYHLGRITTYTVLGGFAGGVFGIMPDNTTTSYVAAALLAFAALGFLGYALPRFGIHLPFRLAENNPMVGLAERVAKPLFAKPIGWRGYLLGMVLGFIPCGLVYAALAAAAASGDPIGGMFAMAAFGIGTAPALAGLGVAGSWIMDRWRAFMKRILPILFAGNAILLLALSWGLVQQAQQTQPELGGPFTLTASDGTIRTEQDFKGKILLVYFGYTFCPDVCPTSLINIADAFDLLTPEELAETQAIFVSVDPDRDTLEALAAYTPHFHSNILGLTGTREQIDAMVHAYQAHYEIIEGQGMADYLVDHSAAIYLMDTDGHFIRHFEHTVEPRLLANAIQDVIKHMPHEITSHARPETTKETQP